MLWFRKNNITKGLYIVLLFIMIFGWIFSGWPIDFNNILFSNKVNEAVALTGVIVPNGDYSDGWEVSGSSCSGAQWCTLDEDRNSPNTSDRISKGTLSGTPTDDFTMTTLANVNTATQVQVYIYGMRNGLLSWGQHAITLNVNGSDVSTQNVNISLYTYDWRSVTFSGLSLNQSAVDSIRIKVRPVVGGAWETHNIATMYAEVTYTALPAVEQGHYRWRNDDGAEGAPVNWYDVAWGYRKKITIDNTKVSGSANHSNFPVLIKTTDLDWRYTGSGGYVGQTDGGDILFTSSNGLTKLSHEIESYNSATGELIAWVKVPTLDYNDDTDIYIYYGNAGATDQWNPTGVWDANYRSVLHMNETSGTMQDSTSNNNDGSPANGVVQNYTGKISGGSDFDGNNDYVNFPVNFTQSQSEVVLEMWADADVWDERGFYDAYYNYWFVDYYQFTPWQGDFYTRDTSNGRTGSLNNNLPWSNPGSGWHHYAFVYSDAGNYKRIYVDGQQVANTTTSIDPLNSYRTDERLAYSIDSGYYFDGTMDEFRVTTGVVRSADWFATQYANHNSPATFYSIGAGEQALANAATWAADEDTKLVDLSKNTTKRLRFEVSNEGAASASYAYRLEVSGPDPSSCESATYTRVDTDTHWNLVASSYFADGDPTTNFPNGLTDENATFAAGQIKESNDQTASITLSPTQFTELEFALQATNNATDGAEYCFRLTNAGSTSNFTHNIYAEVSLIGFPDLDQIHYRWRNDDGLENSDWYNADWGYRKKITIDADLVSGSADHHNFPVLINRTDAQLAYTGSGGNVGQTDGGDILFTGSDGLTKLDHEIESYTSSSGALVAWVEVPVLDYNDDTEIYIYYGNASVADQWNPTGVWDSDYLGVWHLADINNLDDSTTNNNNGTNTGTVNVAGKFGQAIDFEGADYVTIPSSAFSDLGTEVTVSLWIYGDAAIQPQADTMFLGTDSSGQRVLNVHLPWSDSNIYWDAGNSGGSSYDRINKLESTASKWEGAWNYYVFTKNVSAGTMEIFQNGVLWHSGSSLTRTFSTITNFNIGGGNYDGYVDEFRASKMVRSDDWIATEFANQNNPSAFYSVSAEESFSGATATWATDEDTKLEEWDPDTALRVRFMVSNEGTATASPNPTFRLQVAQTDTCSSGSYSDVPTDTSGPWQIFNSTYITDGEDTENISGLTDEASNFIAGELKDSGNTTSAIALAEDYFTEVEFSVKATANAAGGSNYCFRLYNTAAGATLDTYSVYAEIGLIGAGDLIQSGFRWFENNDSALATTTLADANTAATLETAGQAFRLRLLLHATSTDFSAGFSNFKLQFATKSGECDTAFVGESYEDVTTATDMAFYNNPTPADGASVILNSGADPGHAGHTIVGQTYEELNNFTSISDIPEGQDGLWDFALIASSTPSSQSYCFRVVNEDNTPLSDYLYIPEITTATVYYPGGTYISHNFDAGASSVFNVIEWDWSKTNSGCASCNIALQIQTAPDDGGSPGAWSATWCGPDGEDGDETDYFTVNTGQLIHTDHNGDQWIRYRATFYGDTFDTPILERIKISYQQ